jgi:hypothetical protein
MSPSSSLYKAVSDSLNVIQQQLLANDYQQLLPDTADSFLSAFTSHRRSSSSSPSRSRRQGLGAHLQPSYVARGLQTQLSDAANKRQKRESNDALTSIGDPETRAREAARYHGIQAPHASAWLNTIANDSYTTIPNQHYQIAARLRLGLPPEDVNSDDCHSCRDKGRSDGDRRGKLERDQWHHLNCIEGHGGNEITIRHHLIVDAIARYSRLAGAVVHVEPLRLFDLSQRRPDIRITLNYITYLLDISVTNPTAPSIIKHVNKPLAAARRAEKRKERSYELPMQTYRDGQGNTHHGAVRFVPFVLEAFGGMGGEAEKFLSSLSAFSRDNLSAWSHYDVVEGLKKAVAIALQRGNGMIMCAGYSRTVSSFNSSS